MTFPLAHHSAIAALPVFAPALIVCLVLFVHYLRDRRHWDGEGGQSEVREEHLQG